MQRLWHYLISLLQDQGKKLKTGSLLLIVRCVNPRPEFNTRAAFLAAIPWPRTPAFGIPSAGGESKMKLFCMRVLEDLTQSPGEVLEMLVIIRLLRGVTPEIERGK